MTFGSAITDIGDSASDGSTSTIGTERRWSLPAEVLLKFRIRNNHNRGFEFQGLLTEKVETFFGGGPGPFGGFFAYGFDTSDLMALDVFAGGDSGLLGFSDPAYDWSLYFPSVHNLDQAPIDSWLWLRYRLDTTILQAKLWVDGTDEPGAFQYSVQSQFHILFGFPVTDAPITALFDAVWFSWSAFSDGTGVPSIDIAQLSITEGFGDQLDDLFDRDVAVGLGVADFGVPYSNVADQPNGFNVTPGLATFTDIDLTSPVWYLYLPDGIVLPALTTIIDAFGRVLAGTWATSDSGVAWDTPSSPTLSVAGGQGLITLDGADFAGSNSVAISPVPSTFDLSWRAKASRTLVAGDQMEFVLGTSSPVHVVFSSTTLSLTNGVDSASIALPVVLTALVNVRVRWIDGSDQVELFVWPLTATMPLVPHLSIARDPATVINRWETSDARSGSPIVYAVDQLVLGRPGGSTSDGVDASGGVTTENVVATGFGS